MVQAEMHEHHEIDQEMSLPRAMAMRALIEMGKMNDYSKKAMGFRFGTNNPVIEEERADVFEGVFTRLVEQIDRPIAAQETLVDVTMQLAEQFFGDFMAHYEIQGALNGGMATHDFIDAVKKTDPQYFVSFYERYARTYHKALELADIEGISSSQFFLDEQHYRTLIRSAFADPAEYLKPLMGNPMLNDDFLYKMLVYMTENTLVAPAEEKTKRLELLQSEEGKAKSITQVKGLIKKMYGYAAREEVVRFWGEQALEQLPDEIVQMMSLTNKEEYELPDLSELVTADNAD